MSHHPKVKEVEIKVILGLIIIALINVLIYKSLSVGEPRDFAIFNDTGIFIYLFCIVAMIVFIAIKKGRLLGNAFLILLAIMTINIILNLIELILNHRISDNGQAILFDALFIWVSSVGVFGFWYWIVDRGGPIARAVESNETKYDLLFPQYQSKIPGWENWKPEFWDYFVFSFFTSTGFSPADTLPLSIRVKILMMIEASISLVIIGMVASRAISLIQ